MSRDTPHTRTLHRALEGCRGGTVALAEVLGVSVDDLSRWLAGDVAPPLEVYLAALDIVAKGEPAESAQVRQLTAITARRAPRR